MKKKLIEVALPLDKINAASSKEKSIRHGHPSTLHLWWSRKPLATSRAVLFASLVDDPSDEIERQRLYGIIEKLVQWEKNGNEENFAAALDEIKKSVGDQLPVVFDPFAGGGTIPLEAQRLGLKSFAADINPVAVMINRAMIEIPAAFRDQPPVNIPAEQKIVGSWHGAEGLAEDILHYGKMLKALAEDAIGNLYPKIYVPELKRDAVVIAWLWARNVKCSNPSCGCRTPLVHSFQLSTKQKTFVEPIVDGDKIRFEVRTGDKNIPAGTVDRNGARCLFCGAISPLAHVRAEAKAGRMGAQMMAIVAEGDKGRIYLPPDDEHERIAAVDKPDDYPEGELPDKALGFRVQEYGIREWHQLFTNRQLKALTTFGDLISEIQSRIREDGGSKEYADAVTVYLAFLIDKLLDYGNSFCMWSPLQGIPVHLFGRQAISMVWFFAEANPFSNSSGCFDNMLEWIYKSVKGLPAKIGGKAILHSALKKFPPGSVVVSTDPPYYDNIGYAALSDFFYVWLRRALKNIYPDLFGRMTFDKDEEVISEPARHGGDKAAARKFFEDGMFNALKNIYEIAHPDYPTTIYYAFKQQDSTSDGTASTGWETMLNALIRAGFQITATWPMRTERKGRMRDNDSNALASSIVLACRKRPPENKYLDRNEFGRVLKAELRDALSKMQQSNISPVDMAQAAIGPGIAVYSRYDKIVDLNDNELSVRDALKIINAELDEYFNGQSLQLDEASQFCVDLFRQCAFNELDFGSANTLAQSKNTSVAKLQEMQTVIALRGRVRLRDRDEMPALDANENLNGDWIDALIKADCAWLWLQSLVLVFDKKGWTGSGQLLSKYDGNLEALKNLAYRLYDICEKKSWSKEGTFYNDVVNDWSEIEKARAGALKEKPAEESQGDLKF